MLLNIWRLPVPVTYEIVKYRYDNVSLLCCIFVAKQNTRIQIRKNNLRIRGAEKPTDPDQEH
jgi:hypothetical protein